MAKSAGNRLFAAFALTAALHSAPATAATNAGPISEIALLTPKSGPSVVAVGGDQSVYVALARAGKIGRIGADGAIREYPLPKGSFPVGIAIAPDGTIWFSDIGRNAVVKLDPASGEERVYPVPTKNAWPFQIVYTKDAMLYFTERVGNQIGQLDPVTGTISEYKVPSEGAQPAGMALTPDGQIFFTENSANRVGHFDPRTHRIVELAIPSPATPNPFYGPAGAISDAQGNVWFAELDGRLGLIRVSDRTRIEEFSLPNPKVRPGGVAVDDWGYVWFTGLDGNSIGSFDPETGAFAEYAIPSGAPDPRPMSPPETSARGEMPVAGQEAKSTRPFGIAIDGRGRVWFSEQYGHRMGVLTPDALRIAAPRGAVDGAKLTLATRQRDLPSAASLTYVLDGIKIGSAPLLDSARLAPGRHHLTVEARNGGHLLTAADTSFDLVTDWATLDRVLAEFAHSADPDTSRVIDEQRGAAERAISGARANSLCDALEVLTARVEGAPASSAKDLTLAHLRYFALYAARDFPVSVAAGIGAGAAPEIMTGDRIAWRNAGKNTLEVSAVDGSFHSPQLASGQSWSQLFPRETKLAFTCGRKCGGTVTVLGRRAVVKEYPLPGPERIPTVLTIGADHVIWAAAGGGGYANLTSVPLNNRIERLAVDGAIAEFTTPTPASAPTSIKHAPDGTIWFTERVGNKIGRLDPRTGAIREFPVPTANAGPTGIAVAADGFVWFTEKTASKVGRLNPRTGAIQEFATPHPNAEPSTVVVDHEAYVWFDERGADNLIRMNAKTHATRIYHVPTKESRVIGLVPDARGYMWFLELRGNKIGRLDVASGQVREIAIPTPLAAPFKAFLDRHGRLWFTQAFGNKIGVLQGESIREFALPKKDSMPGGIEIDNEDNVWFTEQMGNAIDVMPKAAAFLAPDLN